jgi:hypothetical protein
MRVFVWPRERGKPRSGARIERSRDPGCEHRVAQLVLEHDAVAMPDEVEQCAQDPSLDRDVRTGSPQLEPRLVQLEVLKSIDHRGLVVVDSLPLVSLSPEGKHLAHARGRVGAIVTEHGSANGPSARTLRVPPRSWWLHRPSAAA